LEVVLVVSVWRKYEERDVRGSNGRRKLVVVK
jgi:hypothetical protein